MSIDLRNEELLTLNQAARKLPASRRGRSVHLSCVYRWILDGVKTPHGQIRLEAIRVGGRWLTSVEALERFATAQTPNLDERQPLARMSKARRREVVMVEAQVAQGGI